MPVKTKVIEIPDEIVLLHVLLLYALFDKTTEFEAELLLLLVNVDKLLGFM
jgi:hypothetical protein